MKFFDLLNTPVAVVVVLAVVLVVNGLLLYRYQASLELSATASPACEQQYGEDILTLR